MVRICCVTYKKLDSLVRNAIADIHDEDMEILIVEGLRDEILERVSKLVSSGLDIIIAGGANAKTINGYFNVPVLEYKITDFDYVMAVEQAFMHGEKPAIVTYKTGISQRLTNYFEQKKQKVINIVYEDSEELKESILESSADVIIGAAYAVEIGNSFLLDTILIYPGKDSILEIISAAKKLAAELKKEKERSQFLNTILDYSTNGILLINHDCCISYFNKSVQDFFDTTQFQLRNQSVDKFLSESHIEAFLQSDEPQRLDIIHIEDQEYFQSLIKIGNNSSENNGAVLILSKLSYVRKAELEQEKKARQKLKDKGFRAKKKFSDIVGRSYAMKKCKEDASFFANSDANVLIFGETGVGKEVFTQSIHNSSCRSNGPFIAVNCAALPDNLLETELFGYDEGAFTGGKKGGKEGLFELADNGTLFLDEIGEIAPSLQVRLLRVLQEKEIMHVGGNRIIPVNVRVISATNRNLEKLPQDQFRRDLLYRLNVLELYVPPLRERGTDASELFEFYYKKKVRLENLLMPLPEAVSMVIASYSWPGNIRELQNVCERYCLYIEQSIKENDLYFKHSIIRAIGEERLFQDILKQFAFDGKKISFKLVEKLQVVFSYTKEQIAQRLGTSRTTIWRLLKEK